MTYSAADTVRHDPNGPIVLVGGSGVVGRALAKLLCDHDPHLSLCVTSRQLSRARTALPAAAERALALDLADRAPFTFEARAVVALVNDPADRLLSACVAGSVPFVDITRYTPRLVEALERIAQLEARAPVMLASGWMGGIVPLLARALADRVGPLDLVDTAILYDLADRAGPDSVEFLDRMDTPFTRTEDGASRVIEPLSCAGHAVFGERRRGMLHLDTPEQHTLPRSLGARTAITRIGFTSEAATCGLYLLASAGFFRRLRGDRFRSIRRAVLYANGSGGCAKLRVSVSGAGGRAMAEVVDPEGQAHLTAVGARLALGAALGLDGEAAPSGAVFPEERVDPEAAVTLMRRCGVDVSIGSSGFERTAA